MSNLGTCDKHIILIDGKFPPDLYEIPHPSPLTHVIPNDYQS